MDAGTVRANGRECALRLAVVGERCDTFLTEKVRRKTERMVKNTCRTNDPTGGMMG